MPEITCKMINDPVWEKQTLYRPLLPGKLDICRIRLSENVRLPGYFKDILSIEEQNRAISYIDEHSKNRFIINRIALRMLLGKYLNILPADILFITGPNNKPYVGNTENHGLYYNVSHSGDWMLIAISDSEVGIDIEQTDNDLGFEEVLPVCFSKEEIDLIQRSEQSRDLFYLLWTRKEALLKATSKGLDDDIINVPCIDGPSPVNEETIGSSQNWMVNSFKIADQYTGSIAYSGTLQNINFLDSEEILRDY